MIGDAIVSVAKWWKQLWCHHEYRWHALWLPDFAGLWECKKCGRYK